MDEKLNQGASRVVADLKELAALTADNNGAQRLAWTPVWQKARDWFAKKATDVGAEVTIDAAGNQWAKLAGQTKEAVAFGSHLDSVPNGGDLDGALGVVAALEVLRRYSETGMRPKKTIYAVNWSDEEGARYGYSCFGSSAASGSLDLTELTGKVDMEGITFEASLGKYGVYPDTVMEANRQLKERHLTSYLELHIEQGPVLENANKIVSCVSGVAGVERHEIEFIGQAAHAGSFPISMRQDAFLAAAQSALGFQEIALKYDAVCTVGQVRVEPDVVTIIPAKCTISLDQRSINSDDLQNMYREAKEVVAKAALDHGVTARWSKICGFAPQLFSEELIKLCKEAVREETGEETSIYSGPLHDAVEMATQMPTVMMFVMSAGGLSHTAKEHTPDDHIHVAVRAFLRLADKVVER